MDREYLHAIEDRADELHRQRDDLLARAEKAEGERDKLRSKLEELKAAYAAMRGALALAVSMVYSGEKMSPQAEAVIQAALSSSCGKAILARVTRLEQAEGLLRRLVAESTEPGGQCAECTPSTPLACTECNMGEAHGYFNPQPKESDYDSDDEPKEGESRG